MASATFRLRLGKLLALLWDELGKPPEMPSRIVTRHERCAQSARRLAVMLWATREERCAQPWVKRWVTPQSQETSREFCAAQLATQLLLCGESAVLLVKLLVMQQLK